MPRVDFRRTAAFLLLLLLLLLLLGPALAGAAERRSDRGPVPREEVSLWRGGLLPALWSVLTRIWGATGSSLDPNGQPKPSEGGSLDPSGRTADNGGSLDPNGGI